MLRVFGLTTGFTTAVSAVVVGGFGVVVAAGTALGVVVVLFVAGATPVPGAAVEPAALVLVGVGVLDVVGAGSVVSGVGSGGNGFDITAAIRSVRPASDPLFRYLYQVVRVSSQAFLLAAFAASVPESATARA